MKTSSLILTGAAALGIAVPAAQAASAKHAVACPLPSKPVVSQLGPNGASFAATADPGGSQVVARFRIGRLLTYPVMLGGGHGPVTWRMTVASLRPGHRYTVYARALGAGCTGERATTFVTPAAAASSRAARREVTPSAPAAVEQAETPPPPLPVEDWTW
jgi:hypothetical protein